MFLDVKTTNHVTWLIVHSFELLFFQAHQASLQECKDLTQQTIASA